MGRRQGRGGDGRLTVRSGTVAVRAAPGTARPPSPAARKPAPLFRRTKHETATAPVDRSAEPDTSISGQKKGRSTPSRKEAEALNKARAKVPRTRKEQNAARKLAQSES